MDLAGPSPPLAHSNLTLRSLLSNTSPALSSSLLTVTNLVMDAKEDSSLRPCSTSLTTELRVRLHTLTLQRMGSADTTLIRLPTETLMDIMKLREATS